MHHRLNAGTKEQGMNSTRKLIEAPKERLERVAKSSHPFRRELGGPNYLIAVALVLLIFSMVAVGVSGGDVGL